MGRHSVTPSAVSRCIMSSLNLRGGGCGASKKPVHEKYKADVMDGRGTHRYPNGDTYEGEWLNRKFEGKGTYRKVIPGTLESESYGATTAN